MTLGARACLLWSVCGCGGSPIAAAAEAGNGGHPFDASGAAADGTATDASDASTADITVPSGQDSAIEGDVSAADAAEAADQSAGDGAACSGGTFTASVDGRSTAFTACAANAIGLGTLMSIQCAMPSSLTIMFTRSTGNTWKASVEYWRSGSRLAQADGVVTVTAVGAVGGFVDGSVSAPNLQGPSGTASLQGSFHVCRGPDLPAPP